MAAYIYIYMYVYMCVCVCVCIYIYIYMVADIEGGKEAESVWEYGVEENIWT